MTTKKFITLNRVCVPLTLQCDLDCSYCYRHAGRIIVPEFNDLMREFLSQLNPDRTQAVVASGGEPLLVFDKVKELFSYLPDGVHRKVMTNGLNLTQEIVDYLNQNNIETYVSHDGDATEKTRGYDVLKDPEINRLVRQINHLTISCVNTKYNPNPYDCYLESKKILGNRHIWFHCNAVFVDKCLNHDLVDGFDYKAFFRGKAIQKVAQLDWRNPIPLYYRGTNSNVLPNGDIVGMAEIHHKYGTVLDSIETIIENQRKWGDRVDCQCKECYAFNDTCVEHGHYKSDHYCNITKGLANLRGVIRLIEEFSDENRYDF